MESHVLLGHFSNGIYIRILMEINVTSIAFTNCHHFSLFTESLYHTCALYKRIQNSTSV